MNDDLTLDKNHRKGSKGKKIRLIQEWLCLQGIGLVIDGDFGPAADCAVRLFQRKKSLREDGIVGRKTFAALIAPMEKALAQIPPDGKSLGQMVVGYAKQHLIQQP